MALISLCDALAARRPASCGYDGAKPFVFIVNEKHTKHSAIIYGGRQISDDRFSAMADPQGLTGICN
jgi:hypothetical protein